jgi:hypothetical protein
MTSTVTATIVAGSLAGSAFAADIPKFFPRHAAVATTKEFFAAIL